MNDELYPRFVERRVREALTDTRVVFVCGPRQSGKTTLAQMIAGSEMPFVTLDEQTDFNAASADPVGFLRRFDAVVLDEIQRVPELILAIKVAVDRDPSPGRFLITGSANLMTLPIVADSLAGRMHVARLMPLAQAEVQKNRPSFLDEAFAGKMAKISQVSTGDSLIERVLTGGYPEALRRTKWRRRRDWLLNYVEAIIQRDVQDIANIDQLFKMPQLLQYSAEFSGKLVNYASIGSGIGMNHATTRKYLDTFERLFLVYYLPPWYSSGIKRIAKTAKLHFLDSGLLAALLNLSSEKLEIDRTSFGRLLESFVVGELLKLASFSDDRYRFSHFRHRQRDEVDIVVEDMDGRIVGIEVKASATVALSDFSGLKKLEEECGDRFTLGVVLYDHEHIVSFGERLLAVPISALWN